MRLVLIEWSDSYGCSTNWQTIKDYKPVSLKCRSVGWLLHDGDDVKIIVPHIAEEVPNADSQGCGDMTIPACSVTRMVDLTIESESQ